jgi:hypothetical protein
MIASILLTLVVLTACGGSADQANPEAMNNMPEDSGSAEETEPTDPPAPTETPEPTMAPGYEMAMQYSGTWEGTWKNTTFGSEGPITITGTVYQDGTVTMEVDVGGFVFGLIDPDPQTYTGTYDANGVLFSILDDPIFGQLEVEMDFNGTFSAMADLIPEASIASMQVSGTFGDGMAQGEYMIEFAGGGGAEGVIELTQTSQ